MWRVMYDPRRSICKRRPLSQAGWKAHALERYFIHEIVPHTITCHPCFKLLRQYFSVISVRVLIVHRDSNEHFVKLYIRWFPIQNICMRRMMGPQLRRARISCGSAIKVTIATVIPWVNCRKRRRDGAGDRMRLRMRNCWYNICVLAYISECHRLSDENVDL